MAKEIEVTARGLIDSESGLKYGIVFNSVAVREDGFVLNILARYFSKKYWHCGSKNKNGYLEVSINYKNYKVHRLVASVFISNPDNKEQVNHKDGNKTNNSVYNLEWCTQGENIKHSYSTGLHLPIKGKHHYNARKIKGTCLKTGKEIIYNGGQPQMIADGFSPGNICSCCLGNRKSHKGFKWEYLD